MTRTSVEHRKCRACGDNAVSEYIAYCMECYQEVKYGIVGPPPKPTMPAGRGTRDDISPWQENAIRDMEDG